jgi:hypothetical protein
MSSALESKARFRFRWRLLREGLFLVAAALAIWAALAYLALPAVWKRAQRQAVLTGQDMITRTSQGLAGDPINFGLVGDKAEMLCAFRSAGWTLADSVTLRTSLKIAGSVAFRRPDLSAPVSPLYYNGRVEDVAFESQDGFSAARRHHIRLWRIGSSVFDDRPLWLAAASYDRGVGVNRYTLQLTHRIDGDVDAEREFVGKSLSGIGAIRSFFQVQGIGPTLDARNGGGDPYFTDGEVLVGVLAPGCALRPGAAAIPRENPPHIDLRSAIIHALGPSRNVVFRNSK